MSDVDDIVQEFLVESTEGLDRYDQDLMVLERDPSDEQAISDIFRTIHTIKGTCGFLGFAKLEQLAHAGESLLSQVRSGDVAVTSDVADALLGMGDAMRQMLQRIEHEASEGEDGFEPLISTLLHLREMAPDGESTSSGIRSTEPARATAPVAEPRDSSVRVSVELLDRLMNLVGELVLTRNRLLQPDSESEPQTVLQATQQLNALTTELQEHVMQTRMRPIGDTWRPLRRMVRDLAHACGKQVRLTLDGTNTELDKTLIEAIKDPITHLVRNAIDHGIETPPVRRVAGKPEEGLLTMRSFHEGGLVNIEVTDDGAGFDIGRLKVEAVRRGLLTTEQVAALSDREASSLVFLPGLTTAKEVTNLSGRGVGMDVVKTNIERIGGTIEIHSERGRGTTFRIKIPLTLAIVAAQLVGAGAHRFAIPQVNVLEVIRLDPTDSSHRIEVIHRTHVYRLRGQLLPLLFLEELLDLDVQPPDDLERSVNIVVVNAHDRVFGLVVDTLLDTQEIVVKPLAEEIARLHAYAGATIMGDGSVVLILDVIGLGRRGGLLDDLQDFRMKPPAQKTPPTPPREATLLVTAGGRRYAMPLTHVVRLETFAADAVEFSGPTAMVQHQGTLLPLAPITSLLGEPEEVTARDVWPVVVVGQGSSRMGLVVDAIVDVVHDHSKLERRDPRTGIAGSAVIRGRLTDVLDVRALLRAGTPASEVTS